MVRQRLVGRDLDLDRLHACHTCGARDPSGEQARDLRHDGQRRATGHHDDVELAVVQGGGRGDACTVAVLASVGEGDEERPDTHLRTVRGHDVGSGRVGHERRRRNGQIPSEAAPREAVGREPVRHVRIETDAGDVEEEPAITLTRIDAAHAAVERRREGTRGIQRNTQLARQTIARPAGDDAQRRLAKRERRRHFVDRAVSAPREDGRDSPRQRRLCQFARMPDPFGHEHLRVETASRNERRRLFRTRASHPHSATGAGYRVDNDDDRGWHHSEGHYIAGPAERRGRDVLRRLHEINMAVTAPKFPSDTVLPMFQTLVRYVGVAVFGAITTACGGGSNQSAATTETAPAAALITVDGSSTVFPIAEAVAEEFGKANPGGRTPTVGISGTGGGFQKFCRDETNISNASRPIRPSEIEACKTAGVDYIELPIAYDGLAIVVNQKNTWATTITVAELKTLLAPEAQGNVMRWNQIRASWPDRDIRLFGAGVDSGTYDYFTEATVGKEGSSRGDFTSSEDDNVIVQGVSSDELALGFLPLAYVEANSSKLKIVPVDDVTADNGAGPIVPSAQTVRDGTYQPLSRPLFIYVSRKAADRAEVQAFVEMFFSRTDLVREVGYVELTPTIYDLARTHFANRKLGTAFGSGGSQVGMSLESLLAREQ